MIRILAVGKVKDKNIAGAIQEYMNRLKHVSFATVQQEKGKDGNIVKKKEGERLLKRFKEDDYIIALSEEGKVMDSVSFSSLLKKYNDKKIVFVLGGAFGLSDVVNKKADLLLSLSALTFPHEVAQLLLVEQVYRAQMINTGRKYHK